MKKKTLLSALFVIICSSTFQTKAQETITNDNFPLEPYTSTMVLIDPIDYIAPTEGPNQQWDYSSLPNNVHGTPGLYEANNPDFPNAVIYKSYLPTFDVYEYQRDDYYEQNQNGRFRMGSVYSNVGYSITDKTGGALDSLWFGGTVVGYQGGEDLEVKFPLEYETQWTSNYTNASPFQLSVAAFGLDHAQGILKETVTRTSEAVAYGTLVLPRLDGSTSDPIDVILLKNSSIYTDSVYLNNEPAPPALMAAFSLTQGGMVSYTDYIFYTPNYQDEVMVLSPESGTGIYRIDVTTLDIPIFENSYNQLAGYPNPIAAGEQLTIKTDYKSEIGSISISNLLGQVVYSATIHNDASIIRINIPQELTKGTYLYQLNDSNGKLIGSDVLSVQ